MFLEDWVVIIAVDSLVTVRKLEARPLVLDEFDEKLWAVALEKVKVLPDGRLLFQFKNGAVVEYSRRK